MSSQEEKTIREELVFKGKLLELRVLEVETPKGKSYREIVRHPGAAAALVVAEERFLLVRQYRKPVEAWTWEIPAGKLDVEGEDPLDCIIRELKEEAGISVDPRDVVLMGSIYTTPGFSNEIIHLFLVELPRRAYVEPIYQEEISKAQWFSLDEIKAMVKRGELKDSKTLSALALYFLIREK